MTPQWTMQQPKLFDLPLFLNNQVTSSELRYKVRDWVNTSLNQGVHMKMTWFTLEHICKNCLKGSI